MADTELDRIIGDYLAAQDAGTAPPREAFLAAHPAHREELARFLDSHHQFDTPQGPAVVLLPAGTRYAGCEVLGVAGIGGAAVVYRGRQSDPPREVALKVFTPDPARPAGAERFRREAAVLARLAHPHVAPVFAAGAAGGRLYLLAEWLPGGTLSARLGRMATDPRRAAAVVRDLARGVAHAHAGGVLHRDLKPANVLFDAADRPKLVDFGLAAAADQPALTRSDEAVGTPQYMAPEQAQGEATTTRTDVHGLGAVLYAALTGHPPFDGDRTWKVLRQVVEAVPAPRAVNRRVPTDLAAVCGKCLEKDPARRYRSADELADDLERFLRGEAVSARPPGPGRRLALWARRRPVRATAIGLGLAAAGAVGWAEARRAEAERQLVVSNAEAEVRRTEAERRLAISEAAAEGRRVAAEAADFYAILEKVRSRRTDPAAGWAADNLGDLRRLAAGPLAAGNAEALRSEAAMALGGLDLRRLPGLADGFPGYAVAVHPTEPAVVVTERMTSRLARTARVRVYDPRDGSLTRELTAPTDPGWSVRTGKPDHLQAAAVSPDGRWLAVGTRGGRVLVWEWGLWDRPPADHRVHDGGCESLAFSGGGRLLYSFSYAGIYALRRDDGWRPFPGRSVDTGSRVGVATAVDEDAADPIAAYARAYPDGHGAGIHGPGGAFVHAQDGGTWLLRAGTHWVAGRVDGVEDSGELFHSWTADGRLMVATAEADRQLRLWDMTTFRPALAALATAAGSNRTAFDPAGGTLYLVNVTAVARFAFSGLAVRDSVAWSPAPVGVAALSPDGRTLATLTVADNQSSLHVQPADRPAAGPPRRPVHGGARQSVLAVNDTGLAVEQQFEPGRVRTRWSDAGQVLQPRDESANYLQADAAGRWWAALPHTVRRWDAPGVVGAEWANDPLAVDVGMTLQQLAPGPAGCLVGRRDGRLIRLDVDARRLADAQLFDRDVSALAQRADGRSAVAGSPAGELAALDPATLNVVWRRTGAHPAAVSAVAVGPGVVASGGLDRTVRLWTPAGEPVLTLRLPGVVRWLAVTPDGRDLFVLVAGERAVRRWRLDMLAAGLRDVGLDPPLGFGRPADG